MAPALELTVLAFLHLGSLGLFPAPLPISAAMDRMIHGHIIKPIFSASEHGGTSGWYRRQHAQGGWGCFSMEMNSNKIG